MAHYMKFRRPQTQLQRQRNANFISENYVVITLCPPPAHYSLVPVLATSRGGGGVGNSDY